MTCTQGTGSEGTNGHAAHRAQYRTFESFRVERRDSTRAKAPAEETTGQPCGSTTVDHSPIISVAPLPATLTQASRAQVGEITVAWATAAGPACCSMNSLEPFPRRKTH